MKVWFSFKMKKCTPTNNKYNEFPDDEGWILAHFGLAIVLYAFHKTMARVC